MTYMTIPVLADTHHGVAFGIFYWSGYLCKLCFFFSPETTAFWWAHLLS